MIYDIDASWCSLVAKPKLCKENAINNVQNVVQNGYDNGVHFKSISECLCRLHAHTRYRATLYT